MDRFDYICENNPAWAVTITEFVATYPEFLPVWGGIPLQPRERIPYTNVNTLFQAVMHYICATGVRYTYAINQWTALFDLINVEDWDQLCQNITAISDACGVEEQDPRFVHIQPSKRKKYAQICQVMCKYGLTHKTLQPRHVREILQPSVKGIGEGCVAWVKRYFTDDDDCVEYTDIKFSKGFEAVYGKEKNTLTQRKRVAKEWVSRGFGRIGNLMTLTAAAMATA